MSLLLPPGASGLVAGHLNPTLAHYPGELVQRRQHPQLPGSWSPDGTFMAFTELDEPGR